MARVYLVEQPIEALAVEKDAAIAAITAGAGLEAIAVILRKTVLRSLARRPPSLAQRNR